VSAEGNRVLECVLHVHNHISIGRYEQEWWQVVGWEWWWWWWVLLRKGTASGSGAHNNSDGGGENWSAEGNKVLKYGLVHGRQWVWAMVGSWEWLGWCWQWLQEAWTLKMAKTKLILF